MGVKRPPEPLVWVSPSLVSLPSWPLKTSVPWFRQCFPSPFYPFPSPDISLLLLSLSSPTSLSYQSKRVDVRQLQHHSSWKWDRLGPGTWDTLLQCLHLDKHLREQQNKQKGGQTTQATSPAQPLDPPLPSPHMRNQLASLLSEQARETVTCFCPLVLQQEPPKILVWISCLASSISID